MRDALAPLTPATPRPEGQPKGLNVLGTFAHHPELTAAFMRFNAHVLYGSTLSPRQRELAVLRVAALRDATYEWEQHALMALGLNTFFTGTDANSIAVNSVVANDVTKIATAQADSTGLVHPGDGAAALAIARLRTKLAMSSSTATFGNFYGTLVSRIGAQTRDALASVDQQEAAIQVVQSLQQQASGVSTDEELINLTQSQNAYAATARYVSTLQTVFDTLIGLVH